MNYISTIDKAPKNPHYSALVFEQIYIEGDERSRTNPGHGYPGHNQDVVKYIEFVNEQEMFAWVEQHEKGYAYTKYKLFFNKPITLKKEYKFSIAE